MNARALIIAVLALGGCAQGVVTAGSQADGILRVAESANRDGDDLNAMALYRSAATSRPGWIEPQLGIGRTLLHMGDSAGARVVFVKAQAMGTADPRPLVGLAQADLMAQRPGAALRGFEAALALDPRNVMALNGAGVALDQMGRHSEAQTRYAAAIVQDPDNRPARNNMGLSLALAGHTTEAVRILSDLADLPDAQSRTRENLRLALALAGRKNEAAQAGVAGSDPAETRREITQLENIGRVLAGSPQPIQLGAGPGL